MRHDAKRLRSLRLLALTVVTLAFPALAKTGTVHPPFWTVHSKTATAYLLGSVHVLPFGTHWQTPEIAKAMETADTFYFETSFDPESVSEVARYLRYHHNLPERTTLRSLLDNQTLADYQHALAVAHVSAEALDDDRPWFAAMSLGQAYSRRLHYAADFGVDFDVWDYAKEHHRTLRAFETTQQQIDLIMPSDRKLELAEFGAAVRDLQIEHGQYRATLDAWSAGDIKTVGALLNKALDEEPIARKVVLDDRNKRWMKTFDFMLSGTGTYFVTVGAGHMIGPNGVPALLRARGYRVEGPATN